MNVRRERNWHGRMTEGREGGNERKNKERKKRRKTGRKKEKRIGNKIDKIITGHLRGFIDKELIERRKKGEAMLIFENILIDIQDTIFHGPCIMRYVYYMNKCII